MAKQKKAVIDARIDKLKSLGYESVPNSQGNYQTIREVERMTIQRKDIEYQTDDEWNETMQKVDADHTKHLKPIEAETIEPEQVPPAANLQELVIRVEKEAETGIATFDANKAKIAEWKGKYAHLKFTSLDDTENNNLIEEGWRTARTTRLALEKREDFLKAPFIAASKKIGGVAGEYYVLLAEIENPLKEQREKLKAAKEEEKNRAAIEAEKEAARRVEVLKEAGLKFDGQFYYIGETISMDYGSIKAMTPEVFEKFVATVQAEKKRLDELEAQELQQLKDKRLKDRGDMLKSVGMEYNGTSSDIGEGYYFTGLVEGVKIGTLALSDEPDDKFMALFTSISGRIAAAKKKEKDDADKKAKERTVTLRSRLLLAIGMEKVDWIPGTTQSGFYFKNDFFEIKLPISFVENDGDDEFDARLEQYETQIIDAKGKAAQKEADDKAAEQLANTRREQLIGLGLTSASKLASYVFTLPDATTQCSVAYGELTGQSAETWEATIKNVTDTINKILVEQQDFEAKAKQEEADRQAAAAKAEATFTQRQYDLVNLKMVIVAGEFIIRNEYGFVVKISIDEVKAIDEDMWPAKLTEITGLVDNLKKHTEEQRKAEAAKAEALKPELQKLAEYIAMLSEVPVPEFKDEKIMGLWNDLQAELNAAMNKTLDKIELLKK